MELFQTGPRLIIVCGLPGSGKTTHAKELEEQFRAVRLAPDEWMTALAIDLYDEDRREKVESLQWQLCKDSTFSRLSSSYKSMARAVIHSSGARRTARNCSSSSFACVVLPDPGRPQTIINLGPV